MKKGIAMIDRENEFFNKIETETMDEKARSSSGINYGQQNEKSNIKNTIIAITAGAVFAGILVIIFSLKENKKAPTNLAEIPTLNQPTEPIKIAPDNIGNTNEVFDNASIYNNEDDFFNMIETENSINNKEKKLQKTTESMPTLIENAPLPTLPKKIEKTTNNIKPQNATPKKVSENKKIEKPTPVAPVKPIKKTDSKKTQIKEEKTSKQLIEKATNVAGEVEVSVAPTKNATNNTNTWNVQLTSTSSQEAAQNEWNNLQKKYPSILGNKSHTITTTEVNGKTYYRLRVSNISSSEEATQLCNQLKAYKLSCFVIK